MVGLGEQRLEVHQVMDDMRSADVDFLTMGQYLQPTPKHLPVDRWVSPDEFRFWKQKGEEKGLRQGKESKGRNPMGEVLLTDCGSIGFCSVGTAVMVYPDGTLYGQVMAEDVPELIEEHLVNGRVVKRLALMELGNK